MINVSSAARKGFTLIELMITITIIGILGAILVPAGLNQLKTASIKSTRTNLLAIKNSITQYQLAVGQPPSRLKDLVKAPADEKLKKRWTGPYLGDKTEVPEDPWYNAYQYKLNPSGAPHQYELYSFGPDGKGSPKAEWIDVWAI